MITESQITTLVGRKGLFLTNQIRVKVKILNARSVFGREDVLISPIDGEGEAWVSSNRVQLLENK